MFNTATRKNIFSLIVLAALPVLLFQTRLLIVLAPLPLMYGHFQFGRAVFIVLSAFSMIAISLMAPPALALLYLMSTVLVALVYCEVAKKNKQIHALFVKSTLILLGCYLGLLLVLSQGHPYQFLDQTIKTMLTSLPQMVEQNARLSPWRAQAAEIAKNASSLTALFLQEKLVGYLIGGLFFVFWITIIILKSLNIQITSTDLSRWKIPDQFIWLFIISIVFNELPVPILSPVFRNIFIVMVILYFFQGLAITTFYFHQKKATKTSKNLIYAALLIFPLLAMAMGLLDIWIDFRTKLVKSHQRRINDESHS